MAYRPKNKELPLNDHHGRNASDIILKPTKVLESSTVVVVQAGSPTSLKTVTVICRQRGSLTY